MMLRKNFTIICFLLSALAFFSSYSRKTLRHLCLFLAFLYEIRSHLPIPMINKHIVYVSVSVSASFLFFLFDFYDGTQESNFSPGVDFVSL